MTITSIIYDFGGVLIGWDPRRAFTGHYPDHQIDAFFHDLNFEVMNHDCDAGRSWAETRAIVADRHPHHATLIDHYVTHFPDTLTGPIPGSEAIARDLHSQGIPLYGLTNWSAELFPHAAPAAPAITLMRDILVSGEVKLAKPDPAIFHLAAQRFQIDPRRTLFIDDSPANIATAHRLGYHTHTFTTAVALADALHALNIPHRDQAH